MQSNAPQPQSILGIWRLGEAIEHQGDTRLFTAQPADSQGSPRFDYVVKTAAEDSANSVRHIQQSIRAATVRHPNVIAVLDASASQHSPFIVMPRLNAWNMDVRVARLSQFALPIALWWTRQTAQALEALHVAGFVHGDVKPANLLVDDTGHVTLIDLGFSARTHSPMAGLFRGTPDYSSPELIAGNTAALPAMDVFALGRVLLENVMRAEPGSSWMMEPIAELIEEMLSPDPSQRPSTTNLVKRLLSLEIDTLGGHIEPANTDLQTRRAA